MYKEIILTIDNQISDLNKQISKLQEERKVKTNAKEAIELLQAETEKQNNNLAIQKEICPFPESCSLVNSCTKNYCNADTCSNGYAYRMS